MKLYKVTITNGNYPPSYTCNTIADAYDCLRTFWHRYKMPYLDLDLDVLMETLVKMRSGVLLGSKCSAYSITVLNEEANADVDLD